jgi:hypothetical protein
MHAEPAATFRLTLRPLPVFPHRRVGCDIGHCSLAQVPERVPFLALLGVLLLLHGVWFVAIVRKGYAELVVGRKAPVGG